MSLATYFFQINVKECEENVNKAFEPISCFTYQIILLAGYVIKWGLIVAYLLEYFYILR